MRIRVRAVHWLGFLFAGLAAHVSVPDARAHAYGTGGVDQYIRLIPKPSALFVELDLHFGEIPAAAMRTKADLNHDGDLEDGEILQFMATTTPYYKSKLAVRINRFGDGQSLAAGLRVPEGGIRENAHFRQPKGENGQRTLRLNWLLKTPWPERNGAIRSGPFEVRVQTHYAPPKCSCVMAFRPPDAPMRVLKHDMPTDAERPLPPDRTPAVKNLAKIPRQLSGALRIDLLGNADALPGESVPSAAATEQPPLPGESTSTESPPSLQSARIPRDSVSGEGRKDRLEKRVLSLLTPPFTLASTALVLGLCLAWGMLHAFSPGHGKVVVSTYLIGTSARYHHAVLVGLLVTLSHTAVVFVLALAAAILKDRFSYPAWLQPLGAIIIILVGLNQLRSALVAALPDHGAAGHDHDHHREHSERSAAETHSHGLFFRHTHAHPRLRSSSVSTRELTAVGVSGGMVPCPAAIIMLLLAWQVRAPLLGFACLVSFSVGLAATLIGLGMLAIRGTTLIVQWVCSRNDDGAGEALLSAVLPGLGGVLLVSLGLLILARG